MPRVMADVCERGSPCVPAGDFQAGGCPDVDAAVQDHQHRQQHRAHRCK